MHRQRPHVRSRGAVAQRARPVAPAALIRRVVEHRAAVVDHECEIGEAAQRALRKAFKADVALIREGGSIPIVSQFRGILGIETLLMGLALADCRAHSPNENFPLENFEGGIRLNKAILQELAQ